MANPLYNQFGNRQMQNNGMTNMFAEMKRLRETVKNPRQEVERLLQSGEMSQSQFNQFSQIANQVIAMMPK